MKNRPVNKIIIFLLLFVVQLVDVNAEARTLKTDGILIEESMLKPIEINTTEADYGRITTEAQDVNVGDVYTVYYNNAFTYNKKSISIKIEFELLQKSSDELANTIKKLNSGLIQLYARSGEGDPCSKFRVSYTFYEDDNYTKEINDNTILFLGIFDPDFGNYYFDTTGKTFYYTRGETLEHDGTYSFDEFYEIKDTGLYRTVDDGVRVQFSDPQGIIAFPVKGSSFEFAFDDRKNGAEAIEIPLIYSAEFNINYVLNGGVNDSDNPDSYIYGSDIDILPPTREGYRFLGWEEGNKINPTDFGDKTFTAKWERLTYNIKTEVINGTIDPSVVVEYENNITINYKPTTGYVLKSIKVDGKSVDIKNNKSSYTFEKVKENHEILVEYEFENPQTGTLRTVIKLGLSIGIIGVIILAKSLHLI